MKIDYLSCNENQKNNSNFFIIGNKEKYFLDGKEGKMEKLIHFYFNTGAIIFSNLTFYSHLSTTCFLKVT